MQALGGLAETAFGAKMTFVTYGAAAPFGWPIMAHGLDQFITGINTAFTGSPRDTLTSQLLQEIGVPQGTANFVDGGLSVFGSLGSAYFIQRARNIALAAFSVPEYTMQGGQNFKSFIKANCRDNLKELTGMSPAKSIEAHHVFAQKYTNFFIEKGINIHHPRYMTWWESPFHQRNAAGYNDAWFEFIRKNPDATAAQILGKGKELMNKHGIEVNY
jgi:hypothetical protein